MCSVEETVNIHRTASSEIALVCKIPNMINDRKCYNCTMAMKENNFKFK